MVGAAWMYNGRSHASAKRRTWQRFPAAWTALYLRAAAAALRRDKNLQQLPVLHVAIFFASCLFLSRQERASEHTHTHTRFNVILIQGAAVRRHPAKHTNFPTFIIFYDIFPFPHNARRARSVFFQRRSFLLINKKKRESEGPPSETPAGDNFSAQKLFMRVRWDFSLLAISRVVLLFLEKCRGCKSHDKFASLRAIKIAVAQNRKVLCAAAGIGLFSSLGHLKSRHILINLWHLISIFYEPLNAKGAVCARAKIIAFACFFFFFPLSAGPVVAWMEVLKSSALGWRYLFVLTSCAR